MTQSTNPTPPTSNGASAPPAIHVGDGEDEHARSPVEPRSSEGSFATNGASEEADAGADTSRALVVQQQTLPVATTTESSRPSLWQRLRRAIFPNAAPTLRSDLESALEAMQDDDFSPEERALLRNILQLREQRVSDVMIPRGDIVSIDMESTLAEALECFEKSGHSRLPVCGDTLDDPRGMVHIRDLMDLLVRSARGRRRRRKTNGDANGEDEAKPLPAKLDLAKLDLTKTIGSSKLVREVLFVPPSMPAVDLMALMQARRIQIALVIDEYGGTDGLASLEDVVEVIVGDIEDEHDAEEEMVVETAAGRWEIDGRAEVEEVEQALGVALHGDETREDGIDTLGGLIFVRLGRVPLRREVVQIVPGYEFQVLEADARRIRRVLVTKGRPRARGRRRAEGPPRPEETYAAE